MKNFLIITGGAGFVGSNLVKYLIQKTKYNLISLDNYSTGLKKNHINNKRIKYIKGDTNEIFKILNSYKNKIHTIFHFGEYARIHQSFYDTKKCLDSNLSGTSKVFSFCLENKIKIIYSATSASLGNKGMDQNLSPYAFTKSNNLKMLIQMNKWFNLSYEALYFYNVYGEGQIKKGPMSTVIGIFETQFEKGDYLTVVRPGNQSRKFTYIKDTIEGCYYAWIKNRNLHYSLSNTRSYNILTVAKMFDKKIKFIKERKGERNKSSIVNNIGNIKIHKYECKSNLFTYIKNFKRKLNYKLII